MKFIDPLFQRVLIDVARSSEDIILPGISPRTINAPSRQRRWRGLPLIYDEVFTGLGRLDSFPSLVLSAYSDTAVYSKLLTGGLVPLLATLAIADIFEAFLDDLKLLHGHSYTAYPVGCTVANKSLEFLEDTMQWNEWRDVSKIWTRDRARPSSSTSTSAFWNAGVDVRTEGEGGPDPRAWSLLSPSFVDALSHLPWVNTVCALGTILAFEVASHTLGHRSIGRQSSLPRPARLRTLDVH